jgi:hypothetical protein
MKTPDNLPEGWEYQPHTNTVICGGCCFRYGAEHADGDDGGWACPNCGDSNNPNKNRKPDPGEDLYQAERAFIAAHNAEERS